MSMKSLLYEDRYFNNDRYLHDRYWIDRFFSDYRSSPLYGRSWRYWNHPLYGYRYTHPRDLPRANEYLKTNENDTLRFNSHVPTRVYYPATVLEPKREKVEEIRIERMPLHRSNSFVSVPNENHGDEKYETNYEYKFVENICDNKSINKNSASKSMSNMTKGCSFANEPTTIEVKPVKNSVTYVYDNEQDKHRHVSYVKHTHNEGESSTGGFVKASETFMPVTRSVNVGPVFNGNSFGILSEHLTIRDTFNVAFQFKTTAQNGVLMIIVDRSTHDSFFIELYDSQLKATLFVDGEADSCWTNFTKPVLSNDIWSDVEVKIINNKMTMTVRNEHFYKTHRFPFRRPIRGDLFVAGYPSSINPPFVCRSKDFFVGEMRNFYVNNDGIKWYGTPSNVHGRLRNWYQY